MKARTRRKSWLLALAVLLVSVVAVVTLAGGEDSLPSGPLNGQTESDGITITGVATDTETTVAIGVYIPIDELLSDRIILDDVELVGATEGLRLDGAVASTGWGVSHACVGAGRLFPPEGCRTCRVEGWAISQDAVEHRVFQIVLRMSVAKPGVYGFAAVAVRYHAAGHAYRAIWLQGGQLCSPRATFGSGCSGTEAVRELQAQLASDLGVA